MNIYRIKSITNYKRRPIEERERWVGLEVFKIQLELNDRAKLSEVEQINGEYVLKSPYREISTSGVDFIKEIDGGLLFSTFSGSVYELERIL